MAEHGAPRSNGSSSQGRGGSTAGRGGSGRGGAPGRSAPSRDSAARGSRDSSASLGDRPHRDVVDTSYVSRSKRETGDRTPGRDSRARSDSGGFRGRSADGAGRDAGRASSDRSRGDVTRGGSGRPADRAGRPAGYNSGSSRSGSSSTGRSTSPDRRSSERPSGSDRARQGSSWWEPGASSGAAGPRAGAERNRSDSRDRGAAPTRDSRPYRSSFDSRGADGSQRHDSGRPAYDRSGGSERSRSAGSPDRGGYRGAANASPRSDAPRGGASSGGRSARDSGSSRDSRERSGGRSDSGSSRGTGSFGAGRSGDSRSTGGSGYGSGRPSSESRPSGGSYGGGRSGDSRSSGTGSYGSGRPSSGGSRGGSDSYSAPRPDRGSSAPRSGGGGSRFPSASSRFASSSQGAQRSHAERASRGRREEEDYEATRGSRPTRGVEIAIPSEADPRLLDSSVRSELRSLSKLAADFVGGHLVAAGQAIDTDPKKALEHARAARGRGARVAAVREATGLAAYHAGEWAEALSELRAARRISGDPSNIAVMADCERAMSRPERALKSLDDPAVKKLDSGTRAELLIVVAGARRDLNQLDAAIGVLERFGLDTNNVKPGSARLWYAYADALEAAGRTAEAIQWFGAAAQADYDDETDAAERAAGLL